MPEKNKGGVETVQEVYRAWDRSAASGKPETVGGVKVTHKGAGKVPDIKPVPTPKKGS